MLAALDVNVGPQVKGAPMSAPIALLATAVEGAQVDLDTAFAIETRYCADLICGKVSGNMIKALFFDLNAINKGASRPSGFPVRRAGRGTACACDLIVDAVARGRMTAAQQDELLARITATDQVDHIKDCDVVVASNTSALPLPDVGDPVHRPGDLVGLHFFSPVDRMPRQRAAVFRYNHSRAYVDTVLSVMEAYLAGEYAAAPDYVTSAVTFTPASGSTRPIRAKQQQHAHAPAGHAPGGFGQPSVASASPVPPAAPAPAPEPHGDGHDDPVRTIAKTVATTTETVSRTVREVATLLSPVEAALRCATEGHSALLDLAAFDQCVYDHTH
jgi:hypothetical protein